MEFLERHDIIYDNELHGAFFHRGLDSLLFLFSTVKGLDSSLQAVDVTLRHLSDQVVSVC